MAVSYLIFARKLLHKQKTPSQAPNFDHLLINFQGYGLGELSKVLDRTFTYRNSHEEEFLENNCAFSNIQIIIVVLCCGCSTMDYCCSDPGLICVLESHGGEIPNSVPYWNYGCQLFIGQPFHKNNLSSSSYDCQLFIDQPFHKNNLSSSSYDLI